MMPFRARRIGRLYRLDRVNYAFVDRCYLRPMENHDFSSKESV